MAGDNPADNDTTYVWMFQSTPAYGGRQHQRLCVGVPVCFNPRPRMAGDNIDPETLKMIRVSIHARVWRATADRRRRHGCLLRFNPRPRMAGDAAAATGYIKHTLFQSTPAYGGRL